MKEEEKYIKYMMILPSKLEVEVHRAVEKGFWARIKNLPGCYTQAEDFIELVYMINDAVFTYFDIPPKYRNRLGRYIPAKAKELIEERNRHQKIEEAINKIISGNKKILLFSKG